MFRLLGFLLFFSFSAAAHQDCPRLAMELKPLTDKIKVEMEALRNTDKIPAITYTIYNDSCHIESTALGEATQAQENLFRTASISKLFTVIAVSQLLEMGILNLDTPITQLNRAPFVRYLQKYETPTRLNSWSKITIRHLMSHQSGISKDVPGALAFFNTESLSNFSYPSLATFYHGLTSVEFLYQPGEITSGIKYSNLGMNLLARIVEAYNPYRLPYSEYIQQAILKPLRMQNTFYDIPENKRQQLLPAFGVPSSNGQRILVPPAFFAGAYEGSIGIASTSADLAKLGQELSRLINGKGKLLRDKELIEYLVTLKSPVAPNLGWASGPLWTTLPGESADQPIWLGHTGTGASERGIVIYSAEKNLGLSILFNAVDANREKYAKVISDNIKSTNINTTPFAKANINRARNFLKATPPPQAVTPAPYPQPSDLQKFVGTYLADIVGPQKITLSADGYLLFYGQKLVVEDITKGRFRFPPIPGPGGILFNREPIVFTFDSNGVPVEARVAQVKIFRRLP
jgi:CubicO group peptidase (beta-lactamase class C family)